MIDGHTRLLGVMGCPVEHTKSPAIHNYLAKRLGINTTYVPFHVEKEGLQDAVKGAYALNVLGLNVTIPHKNDVMKSLCEIDELAAQIGAVNTLVRTENGYKGYNTDMPGLIRAMKDDGVNIKGEKVIILGAGGVARAVAMILAKEGAGVILIFNRTLEKAQDIADEVNTLCRKTLVKALPLEAIDKLPENEKYLAIQSTNVGMHPDVDKAVVMDENFYKKIHTGYDLVYNPLQTKFMELVEAAGGKAYNGLKMLVYQGIIAFELWTGAEVSRELAEEVYKELV